MDRRELLLFFLGLPGGAHGTDQIRVMKGLFLLSKEGPQELRGLYTFEPYDYGPFDRTVYWDLDALQTQGLVREESQSPSNRRIFSLTEAGSQAWQGVVQRTPEAIRASVQGVKRLVTSLSFVQLLRHVYAKYPEYAVASRLR